MNAPSAHARAATRTLLTFFCVTIGCAATPRCPNGYREIATRQNHLQALLSRDAEAAQLVRSQRVRVCYAVGIGHGVLSDNVAFLDGNDSDFENAARLAHLLVHHRDRLGDGCATGLISAQKSEAQATAMEARLRKSYGLPELPPSVEAEADYQRRCASPISATER